MCGIGGVLARQPGREFGELRRMALTLLHRGPDLGDEFIEGECGLFHRLLRIHSPLTKAGPYLSRDKRWVLTFNGEVYNHAELKKYLAPQPWLLHSDAEVFLEGWAQEGEKFLERINGMFAFALWDRREHQLTLGRDRLGEKPLYYTLHKDSFYFASEIKALKAAGVPLVLERDALEEYLHYRYVSGEKTLFKNIFKLAPGHLLRVDKNLRPQLARYWRPQFTSSKQDSLESLLADACRLRTSGLEHQPALFLSGGVDSAGLASFMPAECTAYTYQSPFTVNEVSAARKLAQNFGLHHHIVEAEEENLRDTIWATEEPLGDSIQLPTLTLARRVRASGTRVVISGEGADEVFGGYPHHVAFHHLLNLKKRLGPVGLHGARAALTHAPLWSLAGLFPHAGRIPQESRERLSEALTGLIERRGPGSSLTRLMSSPPLSSHGRSQEKHVRDLRDLLLLDMETWLPSYTLCRMDKILMSQSLEGRLPYLDPRVVNWSLSHPAEKLIGGRHRKRPLRRALTDRLGKKSAWQKKTPFIYDTSKNKKSPPVILESDFVRAIARHYQVKPPQKAPGDFLNEKRLFSLRVLDQWLKIFAVSY